MRDFSIAKDIAENKELIRYLQSMRVSEAGISAVNIQDIAEKIFMEYSDSNLRRMLNNLPFEVRKVVDEKAKISIDTIIAGSTKNIGVNYIGKDKKEILSIVEKELEKEAEKNKNNGTTKTRKEMFLDIIIDKIGQEYVIGKNIFNIINSRLSQTGIGQEKGENYLHYFGYKAAEEISKTLRDIEGRIKKDFKIDGESVSDDNARIISALFYNPEFEGLKVTHTASLVQRAFADTVNNDSEAWKVYNSTDHENKYGYGAALVLSSVINEASKIIYGDSEKAPKIEGSDFNNIESLIAKINLNLQRMASREKSIAEKTKPPEGGGKLIQPQKRQPEKRKPLANRYTELESRQHRPSSSCITWKSDTGHSK